MKRKDAVLAAAVVGIVVAVALLRTDRDRPPSVPPSAGDAAVPPGTPHPSAEPRLPRMVDIGAGRCIPCRRMAPILAEVRAEYAGRADVVFIDVWERPELARGYKFRAIPTQIFYDRQGREVWRHVGFLDKPEIVAQFRRLGVE